MSRTQLQRRFCSRRLVLVLSVLAALLGLTLSLPITSEPSSAQQQPEMIEVSGQIVFQRVNDRDALIGFRPRGGDDNLPDQYPLPVHCAADEWIQSSAITLRGVQLGNIISRHRGGGWIEVGLRLTDGQELLPRARFVPPNTSNHWVISSEFSISIPLPDATPQFRSLLTRLALDLNHSSSFTLPEATVAWWDLAYSLEPDVPGLTFDAQTRRLTGVPTEEGVFSMVYRTTSTGGGSSEMRFTIEVAARVYAEEEQSGDSMMDDLYDDSMMEDDSMMDESDDMLSEDSEESVPSEAPVEVPTDTTFAENPRTGFMLTRENGTSTFSLDVDLTSYQLAQNWAANNYLIEPDSARAEEWVNSFDYGYAPPASDDEFCDFHSTARSPAR